MKEAYLHLVLQVSRRRETRFEVAAQYKRYVVELAVWGSRAEAEANMG